MPLPAVAPRRAQRRRRRRARCRSRFERDASAAIAVRPIPDTDVGRRFPDGCFRLDPLPGTTLERVRGDEVLFADGRSRRQPYLVTWSPRRRRAVGFRITGGLVEPTPRDRAGERSTTTAADDRSGRRWPGRSRLQRARSAVALASDVAASAGDPALVRARRADPLPRAARARAVLAAAAGARATCARVPSSCCSRSAAGSRCATCCCASSPTQNADGDWPQWFMFFERERGIRPGDSHGDIVFWPLLALAAVPARHRGRVDSRRGRAVLPPDGRRARRARDASGATSSARSRSSQRASIPGTRLAAYGHGDWNDSLQPVDPAMRERLCSAWTVTLHHQTLGTLARGAAARRPRGRRRRAATRRPRAIRDDFQRLLVADGALAGFAYFHARRARRAPAAPARPRHRHPLQPAADDPRDHRRPVHARAGARRTSRSSASTCSAPDGARLFDRPLAVPRRASSALFQRAETSTFFGREIGLMYTHAHLRYAEAMARYGDADAFFLALRQANPIGIRELVPDGRRCARRTATTRAPTPAFAIATRPRSTTTTCAPGRVPLEGGWRVYSSGAGIAVRLVRECFLGLRRGTLDARHRPGDARARSTGCARGSRSPGMPGRAASTGSARAAAGRPRSSLNGARARVRARRTIPTAGRRARRDGGGARAAARRQNALVSSSAEEAMQSEPLDDFGDDLGLERGRVGPARSSRSRASRARTAARCGSTSTSRAAAASSSRAACSRARCRSARRSPATCAATRPRTGSS